MNRSAAHRSWSEAPLEQDDISTGIWSEDRSTVAARSRTSIASRSTVSGHSKIALSVGISVSSSQERRESLYSDVSSLSKSSVMGLDDLYDLYDDSKRPRLPRWHSNDMLFDQSMFPLCPVRRSSLVGTERLKPARWSSGQVLPMPPPRPARQSSHFASSPTPPQSKLPSPNAKKISSRRQKVKRAPSRVKSQGFLVANQSSGLSNVSRGLCRSDSERWAPSEGLNVSSQHLPAKPTRRSSVVHSANPNTTDQKGSIDAEACEVPCNLTSSAEPPCEPQRSALVLPDDVPVQKSVHRSHSHSIQPTRRMTKTPAKTKSGGDLPNDRSQLYSERRDRLYARSVFGEKSSASILSAFSSDSGSIASKLSCASFDGFRIPVDTIKTTDSVASASVGSGLSLVTDSNAPALGKDVQQIRRWANTA